MAFSLLASLAMSMESIDTASAPRYTNNDIELLQSFVPGIELSESDNELFVPIIDFIKKGDQLTDPNERKKFNQKLPLLFIFGFDLAKDMNSFYADDLLNLAFDIEEGAQTILTATECVFEKWEAAHVCERESKICIQALKNAEIEWSVDDDEEDA